MRRARDDEGFALVTSIIILTVMIGLGMGLLFLTDSQQKASAREQASESAFNVAEADHDREDDDRGDERKALVVASASHFSVTFCVVDA